MAWAKEAAATVRLAAAQSVMQQVRVVRFMIRFRVDFGFGRRRVSYSWAGSAVGGGHASCVPTPRLR